MIRVLRTARSAFSLLLVVSWMLLICGPPLYLFVLPLGALLRGARRRALTSLFMRVICRGILLGFRAGGARFERTGVIPTAEPSLILMNHQSLLDIVTTSLMCSPYVPAFVPRRRYTRWFVPMVAPCIWLLECPVVDPKRDPAASVENMRRAGQENRFGVLVFPEGHRSVDGQLRAFKPAGSVAILVAQRVPVYVVVTDGFWFGRRFVDFLTNVHRLEGRTEVLGPFQAPNDVEALPEFVQEMGLRIAERLAQLRAARHDRV